MLIEVGFTPDGVSLMLNERNSIEGIRVDRTHVICYEGIYPVYINLIVVFVFLPVKET